MKIKQKIKIGFILTYLVLSFGGSEMFAKDFECSDNDGKEVPYEFTYGTEDNRVTQCMFPALTNAFSDSSNSVKSKSLGDFVENYCKTLLSESQAQGRIFYGSENNRKENKDSQQSLFVYAFCSSFKSGDFQVYLPNSFKNKKNTIADGFTGDIVKTLKLKQTSLLGSKDHCSPKDNEGIPDCDLSVYATEIFSAIMSDMYKIKYAQVLNVMKGDLKQQEIEENVVTFLSGYYRIYGQYVELKERFPQTVDILQSNQKFYEKVIKQKKLKLINNDYLADVKNSLKGTEHDCVEGISNTGINYLACAMHGEQGFGSSLDQTFLTMYYNELLNYRIFLVYYLDWMAKKISTYDKQDKGKVKMYESWNDDMQQRINRQIMAADQTLSDLQDFIYAYPLHVGFLLYQEVILKFRDNRLAPVITLFYSLSEKLQNVQTTD